MVGTSSSPFPGPPPPAASLDHNDAIRRGSLRDITTVSFGNPNALPGPAPSHFFPSVPKAKRDQQRAARLSSPHPPPPVPPLPSAAVETVRSFLDGTANSPSPKEQSAAIGSPSATSNEDEAELEERHRAAKYALASHGPFPSTASTGSPFPGHSNPASLREGSSTSGTPTLKSVGGGGSHGTKRRHREAAERTNWDAASELVRIEREREKVVGRWGHDGNGKANGTREIAGDSVRSREGSVRGEKMGSPPVASEGGKNRNSVARSITASPRDVDMEDAEGEDDEDEDEFDDDDAASVATFKTGASTKSKGKARAGTGEKEPAKKRSRTLTTPAQTAVLNALLAKTRFPSTETREEVGAQIGMSARRVQIWFQNRRQSQKRLRDREVQDSVMNPMPTNASNHSLPLSHGVPVHPHYPYGPPTSDPYAAHRYPQHGQAPPQFQQRFSGNPNNGPFPTQSAAASQLSLHQMQQRPDLSRQTSIDSLASRNSFVSAASGAVSNYHAGRHEETVPPLPNDGRHAYPYASSAPFRTTFSTSRSGPPPTTHQPHSSTIHQQSASIPSKLYFPHVSRPGPPEHSAAPSSRIRTESTASMGSTAGEVKLPSLSALLNSPSPHQSGPPSRQQSQPAHYPPPSQPSAVSNPPTFNRSIFSPPPSSSFERLRISGPTSPPPQPEQVQTTSTSPFAYHPPPLQAQTSQPPSQPMSPLRETSPDILDVAMDTMAYRPAGRSLPPRSTLPPLRSVFGDSTFPTKPRSGAKSASEADKALMAPIASSSLASPPKLDGGPPRLAPISTFPINLAVPSEPLSPTTRSGPAPPFSPSSHFASTARSSYLSDVSAQTRSSMASFEFRHPPPGSTRNRYQQVHHQNGAGWPPSIVGMSPSNGSSGSASNGGGSGESPRHRSSVGSSSRTSVSSERHEK
ncbi:hypothetical protein JCM11491_004400 [Sporobolomyces phaffii]